MMDRTYLREGAAALGIALDERQLDQFALFEEMLADWNQRLNLTRVPREQTVALHFLDSLAAARGADLSGGGRLIDVGTGAGFPGLPLKIAFPGLEVVLLDSTRKKLGFVEAVIDRLGLAGTRTLHARAEEVARERAYRQRFDFASARAVAALPVLAGWLLPFVRVGGTALALKSREAGTEIEEARSVVESLGGRLLEPARVRLPGTQIERLIVPIRRVRPAAPAPGRLHPALPR